jgi:hypothetical protein
MPFHFSKLATYLLSLFIGYKILAFYSACMTRMLSKSDKLKLSQYYQSQGRAHDILRWLFFTLLLCFLFLMNHQLIPYVSSIPSYQITILYKAWLISLVILYFCSQYYYHKKMKEAELHRKYILNSKILTLLYALYIALTLLALHSLFSFTQS